MKYIIASLSETVTMLENLRIDAVAIAVFSVFAVWVWAYRRDRDSSEMMEIASRLFNSALLFFVIGGTYCLLFRGMILEFIFIKALTFGVMSFFLYLLLEGGGAGYKKRQCLQRHLFTAQPAVSLQ